MSRPPARLPDAVVPRATLAVKSWGRADRLGLIVVIAMAVLYASLAHLNLDDRFFDVPRGNDVWFEADMPAVFEGIDTRWADHSRNAHHPVFALATTVPAYALRSVLASPRARVVVIVGFAAGVWSALVYLLLRALTTSIIDALTFSMLSLLSAASIFWLPTAETYVLGSATLVVPLVLLAWDRYRKAPDWAYVAASSASLSVTTTNWISGLLAGGMARPARAAAQIAANALVVVVILWMVQVIAIPSVPFFLGADPGRRFIFPELAGGPFEITRSLISHSIVMPALDVVMEPRWGPRLTVQPSALGSSGAVGSVATALWIVLFVAGLSAAVARSRRSIPHRAIVATLVAQVVLYNCYGEETFLYAMHLAPLLVACASTLTSTRARLPVLFLTWTLIVLLGINNGAAFAHALRFFEWMPASFTS